MTEINAPLSSLSSIQDMSISVSAETMNITNKLEPAQVLTEIKQEEVPPSSALPNEAEKLPFKRKRKSMFDIKPEELTGEVVLAEPSDQPIDNESGQLIIGPGAGGLQPRPSEAKKALPPLTREMEEFLAQAKRFAMEQSVQHVLAKQKVVQVAEMTTLQSSAQRQRALALMCRIYIGSINFQLNEDALRSAFIPFGPIKNIDLSRDSITMQHKGFSFLEYDLPEAAQLAMEQMNNILLGGRNIKVGRPSNLPQAAPWIEQILDEAKGYARIYVSSIHPDLSEHDIQSVFEAFGKVVDCKLAPDQLTGKHKGYGFIEYETQQSANDAIVAMNLFDLGGQYLRVGRAITPPSNTSVQGPPPAAAVIAATAISANIQAQDTVSQLGVAAINSINPLNPLNNLTNTMATGIAPIPGSSVITPVSAINPILAATSPMAPSAQSPVSTLGQPTLAAVTGMIPPVSAAAPGVPTTQQSVRQQQQQSMNPPIPQPQLDLLDQKAGKEQNLAREENLEISGKDARYIMMQKLARNSTSPVLVLRNMVDAEEVDEELETEVTEECSRFGEVTRVIIYQEKQGEEDDAEVIVKIFVEFSQTSEAEEAQKALNGRWFGGRAIDAAIYDEDKYNAQDFSG